MQDMWKIGHFIKRTAGPLKGELSAQIMANIYLDKLDKYMKDYTSIFDKGIKRKDNPVYFRLSRKIAKLAYKLDSEKDETQKQLRIANIKAVAKERGTYSRGNEMYSEFKRIKYVRYADDFLIGVIGSKQECEQIKKDVKNFFQDKLKLELSDDKTLITQKIPHINPPSHCEAPKREKLWCSVQYQEG
jgi:hypothetical protein